MYLRPSRKPDLTVWKETKGRGRMGLNEARGVGDLESPSSLTASQGVRCGEPQIPGEQPETPREEVPQQRGK